MKKCREEMAKWGSRERNVICPKCSKSPADWSEEVREDGQARPSLLIFRNEQERYNLLELAPRLYKAMEEYWREIHIVADLTQRQRQLEQNKFNRAEAQNMARTNDIQ